MATDSWKDRERVKEDEFFERQNRAALEKLKGKAPATPRLSPITGEPMQQVQILGVTADRCPKSGYIGLDAGELSRILKTAQEKGEHWLSQLFEGLNKTKP